MLGVAGAPKDVPAVATAKRNKQKMPWCSRAAVPGEAEEHLIGNSGHVSIEQADRSVLKTTRGLLYIKCLA